MGTQLGRHITHHFNQAIQYEWLETNGLGGYASSTIIGTHTRRYHGLLVAALDPPLNRHVLLSRLDETIHIKGKRFEISCSKYAGGINPCGYIFLDSFQRDIFPEFTYKINGLTLKKTIVAVHEKNMTLIVYEVLRSNAPFTLDLDPFFAARHFHSLTYANEEINTQGKFSNDVLAFKAYDSIPTVHLHVPGASYHPHGHWYKGYEYLKEMERGQDCHEDLYTPGKFSLEMNEGDRMGIWVSTEIPTQKDTFYWLEKERERRLQLVTKTQHPFERQLNLAADQFIVKRGNNKRSIIAGYPWFSDWGRDTMIALPGLCLANGQLDTAKEILGCFAQYVYDGLIPNRFPDQHTTPEYNTVDASLWYFIAIHKYIEAGGDKKWVLKELLPILDEIIAWHQKGTIFNIHEDTDGLISAGAQGTQLTWMDAKAGDWVVTPRMGKAVEINALWYNALKIFARLTSLHGQKLQAEIIRTKAEKVRKRFEEVFWNEEKEALYDVIDGDYKDPKIRPNQVFALCLPYSLLKGKKAKLILESIRKKLLTPYGLRSLAFDDPEYRGTYAGDRFGRDGAYHQGTVWTWLLGPYIDALIKVKGEHGKLEAMNLVQDFQSHMMKAGVGTISEIFDGDAPHSPRGCFAQAWSVAELLRVIQAYQLLPAEAKPMNQRKNTLSDFVLTTSSYELNVAS